MSSFRGIESKRDVYGGNDCMKTFFESFREHLTKIINFERKKIKLLKEE